MCDEHGEVNSSTVGKMNRQGRGMEPNQDSKTSSHPTKNKEVFPAINSVDLIHLLPLY